MNKKLTKKIIKRIHKNSPNLELSIVGTIKNFEIDKNGRKIIKDLKLEKVVLSDKK